MPIPNPVTRGFFYFYFFLSLHHPNFPFENISIFICYSLTQSQKKILERNLPPFPSPLLPLPPPPANPILQRVGRTTWLPWKLLHYQVHIAKERVLLFGHILYLYLYVVPLFLKLLVWLLSFQTLLCSQATASLWQMYNYTSHFEHVSFKASQPIKMRRDPLKPHTTVPKMSQK